MNYLDDFDWEKYNNLVYDSISFEYFQKKSLEFQSERFFEVYVLEEEKLIYIPIAKNASTSIINSLNFTSIKFPIIPSSKFCIDIKYLEILEKYKNGYKFFTVTRNPKQRWISGINEFLYSPDHEQIYFDTDKRFCDKFLAELKNNKFIFDFHTIPQLPWLSFCFTYDLDLTLLKIDSDLNKKISSMLKKSITINHDNKMQDYTCKINSYDLCQNVFTKYAMNNKNFSDLYEMDFYLYNNSL